jgi:hypothetical protein
MLKLIWVLILWAPLAGAQLAQIPDRLMSIPALPAVNVLSKSPNSDMELPHAIQKYSENQIQELADLLNQQFKNSLTPMGSPPPSCSSKEFESYILALQVSGQFDDGVKAVLGCKDQISGPRSLLLAALMESSRYNYATADDFFNQATAPKWKTSPDYIEGLIQRASYSLYGHHEDLVEAILALIPNSTVNEQMLWKALLQRVGEIDAGEIQKEQVNQFLKSQIAKCSGSLKGLLISLQIRIATRDHRYSEALELLLNKASQIENPLYWYYIAYTTLYYGLDQNFSWSRKVYDAYNSYSNQWMNFPTENNTYNYTQLYNSVCEDQLLSKVEGAEFWQIKDGLRTGAVSAREGLKKMDGLKSRWAQKADFLSTYAGLAALQGNHLEALEMYWQAHKLCPYFNRSHWGMVLEKRFLQYSRRPDYLQLNLRIDRELQGRPIPSAISSYIVNWDSLTADVQTRVAYGSRVWLPFMETLQHYGNHSYIKYAFDLLSDSPSLSELQDLRIGGANYPHDNRLWDDVRGVGGSMVVADLGEVFQAVQGDYNLLGHEMAHQFQFLLEEINLPGAKCIESQYQEAKLKKNFPDAYSSQNKEEHFAQGVTYYLVPEDSPSRFGLNQGWISRNNPSQMEFIKSIDESKGDLAKIICKVKL